MTAVLTPWRPAPKDPMRFIAAYPAGVLAQVRELVETGQLAAHLDRRYPARHTVQTDRALYEFTAQIKQDCLRSAPPIHKVAYDAKIDVVHHALGLHTAISRVQGGKLKAKKEIRVASLFRDAPPEFLRMIVVHELAHLRESDHNKAFYRLCEFMEPRYHQLEFDTRLFLVRREIEMASRATE
jgi:predicted metal-dependent hydrolase